MSGETAPADGPDDEPAPVYARERAAVIPGGVNSPVRAFRVGRRHALLRGPRRGRLRLGRRREPATSTTCSPTGRRSSATPTRRWSRPCSGRPADGTSFGAPTEREVLLAEAICARVDGLRAGPAGQQRDRGGHVAPSAWPGAPPAGTGSSCSPAATTATATACWPGAAAAWPPSGCRRRPAWPGRRWPTPWSSPTTWCPSSTADVACVIVEPVAANMGLVPPAPGFLEGLRRRVRPGRRPADLRRGDHRVPARPTAGPPSVFGVRPDLWCFGKVIGGGLPLAAFGGRRDVMDHLAPVGPVYQAGTLSGNPLATAAGLAVLAELDRAATRSWPPGSAASAPGWPPPSAGPRGRGAGAGGRPAGRLFFAAAPVIDYDGATRSAATGRYPGLMHGLLERGVAIAPGRLRDPLPEPGPQRRRPGARPSRRSAAAAVSAAPRPGPLGHAWVAGWPGGASGTRLARAATAR